MGELSKAISQCPPLHQTVLNPRNSRSFTRWAWPRDHLCGALSQIGRQAGGAAVCPEAMRGWVELAVPACLPPPHPQQMCVPAEGGSFMLALGRCQSGQAARTLGLAPLRVGKRTEYQPENPPRLAVGEADPKLLPRDLEGTCESKDSRTWKSCPKSWQLLPKQQAPPLARLPSASPSLPLTLSTCQGKVSFALNALTHSCLPKIFMNICSGAATQGEPNGPPLPGRADNQAGEADDHQCKPHI